MNMSATKSKYIDISVGLSPATPVWPGAPKYQVLQKKTGIGGGEEKTDSTFTTIPHCGTHIDAPLHFARGGKSIDEVDLDLLIGPCLVLEHLGDDHITKEDLIAMGFAASERILIKTLNSQKLRSGELDEKFISLMPDALEHLMQSGVRLLGVDGFSIGPYGEMTVKNHLAFCRAGGIIIEVLDLCDVEAGEYGLIALPIKLVGVEAAPARVVLVRLSGHE
jgi:arylformamidase